ncbi:hypothetical protein MKX03_023841, partial [Papaver bracteatum]
MSYYIEDEQSILNGKPYPLKHKLSRIGTHDIIGINSRKMNNRFLAKSAFEKSANPKKVLATQEESVFSSDSSVAYETTSSSSSTSSDSATSSSNRESGAVVKNICFSYNKKLGLTAIKYKCGPFFCSAHRYPEKHS